jgi:hypothetical protein
MRVACPVCACPVSGEDVDLPQRRALCRPCGELFPLAAAPAPLVSVQPAPIATSSDYRPEALGWAEHVEGRRVEMVLTPARLSALPLFVFALFWDGFLVFWYVTALASRHPQSVMLLFPLLHVGAGVYLTYNALARLLNRSHFAFDRGSFVLESGPIPQRGAREATDNIHRFDVAESSTSFKWRGSKAWGVRMLTHDGKAVSLSLPIAAETEASFVAARLNAVLAIAREPIGYRG